MSQLEDQFGITQNRTRLFEGVAPVLASETLRNELYESASLPLLTEKAKSEFLIAPIFKEIRRHNNYATSFFSGYNFDVYAEKGLTGFCDYLFTAETHSIDIKAPVFLRSGGQKPNRRRRTGPGRSLDAGSRALQRA